MKNFNNIKIYIVLLIDFVLGGLSITVAKFVRLNYLDLINIEIIISSTVIPLIFFSLGIYKRSWRYFSISDLWPLVKACLIANIFVFLIIFIFNRLDNIPRLVTILNFFILIFLTLGSRVIYRTIFEKLSFFNSLTLERIPVLLIGSEDNVDAFIRATELKNTVYKVLGIVYETNKKNKELMIRGKPVLGSISEIKSIIEKIHEQDKILQKIIIISNNIKGSDISNIMKLADKKGMTVGRAPLPNELLEENHLQMQIRDISLEDLLGRRQNKLNHSNIKNFLNDQVVLVTGAGGSIGSELAVKIASFNIKKLVLIDVNENAVYNLYQKLNSFLKKKDIHIICINVRDSKDIEKIFYNYNPQIIYHAAAMKHVSICEENATEAIRTNVLATYDLAALAEKYKSKCFILISTDKAVEPSSIMGATKKIAESVIQSKDRFSKYNTRFITVRFGNVLGSQGSVVPLFKKQIKEGGPITVTHKEVTRFFMTIEEAVLLVLNATREQFNSTVSSRGSISVLNMGASIKIDILAKQMIKLAGLTPNKEITIKYTGLTKGEKLHELLYSKEEKKLDIGEKGFFLVKSNVFNQVQINKTLEKLQKICDYSNNKIKSELLKLTK